MQDIIKYLIEDKEAEGDNMSGDKNSNVDFDACHEPKEDTNDSQPHPTKEEGPSDLSYPPGFEHLKRLIIVIPNKLDPPILMTRLEVFQIKTMLGNYTFDYACSLPRIRSGGLLSIWVPNFVKECSKISVGDCYMINIYGPHDPVAKVTLWNKVWNFMQSYRGKHVLFRDMNEVHDEHESYGSIFSRSEAETFNTFINNACLIDLLMGGRLFTWMNKVGTKLSKLDRFFFSEDVIGTLPDIRVTALDRLDDVITKKGQNIDGNKLLSYEKLKQRIKDGSASPKDGETRIKLLQESDNLEKLDAMDTVQKARINGISK
ncbi:RNA-directed DNA polymerase, eukaryota, reverse transcriptase zinc-binding domain protein, partial [Tanacetum coccineum]